MTNTARTECATRERVMVCTACDEPILVCGAVSDLDPRSYVGMACGCRRPRVPWEQLFVQPKGVSSGVA